MHISWFYWNPNPEAFRIPFLDFPVYIYGVLFVLGFVFGYYILIPLFTQLLQNTAKNKDQNLHKLAQLLVDKLTWFVMAGTIIGARLGHVIFYDWDRYKDHMLAILNIREGGLASHGGAIGVILALILYQHYVLKKVSTISFIQLLDMIVIPTALVGFCIRLGNFFNQEIVGIPSSVSWAIIFANPADGSSILPRHPVQLYEAIAYLFTFVLLYVLWYKKSRILPNGLLSGLFFILVFTARFIIEYWKAEQTAIVDQSFLQMGQILSIPFIILGIALIFRALCVRKCIKVDVK